MGDDVPEEVKVERLSEIIELQNGIAFEINQSLIGKDVEVLIERDSSRSADDLHGRTDTNKKAVFPRENAAIGEIRKVRVERANAQTLFGRLVPGNN